MHNPTLRHISLGCLIAFMAQMLTGCSANGCLDNQNALPLAGFYSATTGQQILADSVEIVGVGAPGDSILYNSKPAASILYMPFRYGRDEVSYAFRYTQQSLEAMGVTDTVTFCYDATPYFSSEECGATYRYNIKDCRYTRNVIDSVAIVDSLVTNIDLERIKIFFRTAEQ